jgi:hypothetical protein
MHSDTTTWENSGSAVILPASVTGSPRFMHQKCQDACRQFMTDQILPIMYFDAR